MRQASPKVKLILNNAYYKWSTAKLEDVDISIVGSVFFRDSLLSPVQLASMLSNCLDGVNTDEEISCVFANLLKKLNGCFSIVAEFRRWVLAAVDRTRSLPLFYTLTNHNLVLTDILSTKEILKGNGSANPAGIEDYLQVGYVTGSHTLSCDYRQLQAGEYFVASRNRLSPPIVKKYFTFLPIQPGTSLSMEQFIEAFSNALRSALKRLIEVAGEKCIAVPLSGGWDSRVIVAALRNMGFNNVTCFSYGPPGNREAEISHAVASALGFKWQFIPYSPATWHDWMASPEMRKYWEMCVNGVSLPCFQDLPAAAQLARSLHRADEMVFAPGHSMDFLAGSHITDALMRVSECDLGDIVEAIYESHYYFWESTPYKESLQSRVIDQLSTIGTKPVCRDKAIQFCEMWDFQERQAKYIVNSIRAYEFVGSSWHLPLWDLSLIELLLQLSPHQRYQQRFYIEAVRKGIFSGPSSALLHIPIAGVDSTPENWQFESTRATPRELLRNFLTSIGILPFLRPIYRPFNRRFRASQLHPLGFHEWFGSGKNPHDVTLANTINGGVPRIPALRKIYQLYGQSRLSELDCLGILAFHSLLYFLDDSVGHDHARHS